MDATLLLVVGAVLAAIVLPVIAVGLSESGLRRRQCALAIRCKDKLRV